MSDLEMEQLVEKCANAMGMSGEEKGKFIFDVANGKGADYMVRLFHSDKVDELGDPDPEVCDLVCAFSQAIDYKVPRHKDMGKLEELLGCDDVAHYIAPGYEDAIPMVGMLLSINDMLDMGELEKCVAYLRIVHSMSA